MHATANGLMNVIQGGDFGSAFASSLVSALSSRGIDLLSTDGSGNPLKGSAAFRVGSSALVGGLIREANGGDFIKGATASAIQMICNDLMHENDGGKKKEEMSPWVKATFIMQTGNESATNINGYFGMHAGVSGFLVNLPINRSREFYCVNQFRGWLKNTYGIKLLNNNAFIVNRVKSFVHTYGKRINALTIGFAIADVALTGKVMPSDILNGIVSGVGIFGGPVGTAAACFYTGCDVLYQKFDSEGRSIGDMLDIYFDNEPVFELWRPMKKWETPGSWFNGLFE